MPETNSTQPAPPQFAGLALLFGAALCVGCSADSRATPANHVHGVEPEPDAGSGPPAILVAERVFSPDARTYYVSIVGEVPSGEIDRSRAYEFTSADIEVFGKSVFIRDREANTITRYAVTEALDLSETGKMSFQPVGLASVRVRNAYVSPTRAYALDANAWRMIEWNPSTMEITGKEVSLSALAKPGLTSGFLGTPKRVGDRIFTPVGWDAYDRLITSPTAGAMLVIDAEAEASTTLLEDPRLGGAYQIYVGGDGAAYVAGVVSGSTRRFGSALGGGSIPHSGLLRIQSGASAFDPGYRIDVEEITGTPGVASVFRIDEQTVLAQIWDPTTPIESIADSDEYQDAREFVYAIVDGTTGTWKRVDSIPKGGFGNAGDHVVDGKLYVNLAGETASSVYPVTAAGFEKVAFTVPSGDLWHFQRIR